MGSSTSQIPAELSQEDVEFISNKAKIDHESVRVWYEKLKVCHVFRFVYLDFSYVRYI